MKSIRGGMGLGDALYLQALVGHLLELWARESFEVCNRYPEVFAPLGERVRVSPFRRDRIDVLGHYARRKGQHSRQWQDVCLEAGAPDSLELRLTWRRTDAELVRMVEQKAEGRPIVLVQLPRAPMGRTDGFGHELLPDCRKIQRQLDELAGRVFFVLVGSGYPLFRFRGIDLDLTEKTSVSQLIDLAEASAGLIGYCSFFVPLAEGFKKPALFAWSARGMRSATVYVRTITPAKILERASSFWFVDEGPLEESDHARKRFAISIGLEG